MESKELTPQELMIGNWLYYNNIMGAQTWVVVKSVGSNHINGDRLRMFDPIPITPEILEMAGFEKTDDDMWVIRYKRICEKRVNTSIGIMKDGNNWVLSVNNTSTSNRVAINYIYYAHQLQNAFFSLTSTHLKIELK